MPDRARALPTLAELQRIPAEHVPPTVSLVDELIQERRQEAEKQNFKAVLKDASSRVGFFAVGRHLEHPIKSICHHLCANICEWGMSGSALKRMMGIADCSDG